MHAAHIYTHIAYIENCVFLWPTEVRTPKHMEHATRHRFQGFRKYIVHKFFLHILLSSLNNFHKITFVLYKCKVLSGIQSTGINARS